MARKLVVVNDNVRLAELGNIYGPISTPTRIPLETIRAMCVKNRDVWECDPSDPRNREKRVKLTLSNYGETHFGKPSAKAEPDYSYIAGGVNLDATDQYQPIHPEKPEEEIVAEVLEPEVPVEEPAKTEESNVDPTPVEAPVQKEVTPQPQNSKNHNGKNSKKGR